MTAIITARIFESTMTAAGADRRPIFSADRPGNLAQADRELARHSLVRTAAWDLAAIGVSAPVRAMDNVFSGVVAVDLDDKVGTTHDEFELARAATVENGDLITDQDHQATYLVAGSSTECGVTKLHQVADGREWADRFTGEFTGLVWVARKR